MNFLNQVSHRRSLNLALLLLVAVLSGCQPDANASRRSAEDDRGGQQTAPTGIANPPASAANTSMPSVNGIESEAPSDPPASDAAGSGATAAAASAGAKDVQSGPSATTVVTDADAKRDATKRASQADAELLLLDDEPLMLGGDEDELSATAADNSRCHHCHLNFVDEELAVTHARAKIGCASCHGNCDAHIADESWASGGNGTPPGIMYPKAKINPFCLDCHPREKLDGDQHEALFAGTSTEKYCTDCHGKHRLTERKCKWK